jgi:3-deoxy-D-manno-octulosonic-acid transferase
MLNRTLYTLLAYLALPIVLLRLLWRGRAAPGYRQDLQQRLGYLPPLPAGKPWLWIHAVSLGESLAAAPLIEALLAQGRYQLLVTNTTPTGAERIRALFGERLIQAYAPYDLPGTLRRFLQRLQPKALIILETELWPNTLAACHARGIFTLLANGRLSAKSARGYARLGAITREMMQHLDRVAAQNAEQGARFVALGLSPAKLVVTGNIKFDQTLSPELLARAQGIKQSLGGRPVVIAGSTHEGEDPLLLEAFAQVKQRLPACLLILVPRHPERFAQVARLASEQGWQLVKRSDNTLPNPADDLWLGDTLGELSLLYGLADVAFVGGSLVPRGGHNMLEACIWGIPVTSGPAVFNFAQIAQDLQNLGALSICTQPAALADAWLSALEHPQPNPAGLAGKAYVDANRGALQRLLDALPD